MKRVIGFACFWAACGMVAALFLPNLFVTIVIILALLLVGYNLFCC